jgi:hypothetical protein
MKAIIKFSLILACIFSVSTVQAFGGLDKLKKAAGGGEKSAPAVSMDDTVNQQEGIVKNYKAAMSNIIQAQILMAEAFDLKKDAAKLSDLQTSLKAGSTLDSSTIEKVKAGSSSQNEKLSEFMDSGKELSADSKVKLGKSILPYALGLKSTKEMSESFAPFMDSASSLLKNGSFKEKLQIKEKLGTGMFIAKETPALLTALVTTSTKLVKYAKSQKVEIPKDATAALDEI